MYYNIFVEFLKVLVHHFTKRETASLFSLHPIISWHQSLLLYENNTLSQSLFSYALATFLLL